VTVAIVKAGHVRTPSRRMPQRQARELGWFGTALFLGLLALLLALPVLVWWPLALLLLTVFLVMTLSDLWRDRRIARVRIGESVCGFARAFDYRRVDTWIIRAVYEEFSGRFPLRASDNIEQDLRIDGDDLDDMVGHIAQRIGRSLERCENNPMFGKVRTLRDLVIFLHHQPRVGLPLAQQLV